MEKLTLSIDMPSLDGETAASLQAFFYALIDAFDAQYCYLIERYYSHSSQNPHGSSLIQECPEHQDPF
jgi:hypothetical protein